MNHLFVLLQFFRNATLLDESQVLNLHTALFLTIKEKFFLREKNRRFILL